MLLLSVPSNTWYGRGTPPSGREVRTRIRLAKYLLDTLAPGLPVYGSCDEDYGWLVPLTDAQVQSLRDQYPESLDDDGRLYLSNGGEHADELEVEFGGELRTVMVTVRPPYPGEENDIAQPPVDREQLWENWWDNYGKN